jgi:hypothetical protein
LLTRLFSFDVFLTHPGVLKKPSANQMKEKNAATDVVDIDATLTTSEVTKKGRLVSCSSSDGGHPVTMVDYKSLYEIQRMENEVNIIDYH